MSKNYNENNGGRKENTSNADESETYEKPTIVLRPRKILNGI
jgi:hypothetical protein